MSIEKRGGRGVIAPSKPSKKQRINGVLAAFIAGIVLFTGLSLVFAACIAVEPSYEEEDTPLIKKDTIPSDIVVTFKNGWEDEFYPDGAPEMKDDPYTKDRIYLGVNPPKINAAYDKTEKEEYDDALKKYNKLVAEWADYTARRDNGDEDAADYLPEEEPSEPTVPNASLPYFPGAPLVDENDIEHIAAGNQPEWDYHTFIGWEIYPAYPDSEGAYELTLTDAITANVTAVAKWADAPARPFKEISLEKADGSGVFEKRLAIPTKLTYEAADPEGEDSEAWDNDDNPNTAPIYVTENVNYAKMDNGKPVIAKYELFKIQENDVQNEPIVQNNPLLPLFERDHYNVNPGAPWKDSTGVSINPLLETFENNAFIYQQWSPKQYAITFKTNGIGSLDSVIDNLDAPTVAQKGLEGVGQYLPTFAGTVTHTDVKEYTFSNWTDAPVGGNKYTNKTKITGDTTLYAQWDVVGGAKYTFITTGAEQKFPVPTTGNYKIEAWGAQGGRGGKGGYSAGTITLTQGVTLYIHVGSQGAAGAVNGADGTGGLGGYNGGGRGGNGTLNNGTIWGGGGGGGGASDVRVVGGAWNNDDGLKSRIIVAGGGGGFGIGSTNGGEGGGINGGNGTGGYQQMAGATQTDGGAFGKATDGGSGNGQSKAAEGRGAGGGGYYGGRGALTGTGESQYGSGSGGSGYVKGLPETPGNPGIMSTAKEFTDLKFTGGVTIAGQNTGNGKVVITFIP